MIARIYLILGLIAIALFSFAQARGMGPGNLFNDNASHNASTRNSYHK